MKKIVLFVLCILSFSCYAQQPSAKVSETQTYQARLSLKVTTLKLNVAGYSSNKLADLKKEYEAWHGKITSVNLDSQNMVLSIEHNALWQHEEIYEMLEKYSIPKGKIISDK